jgi:hypothetical protein
VDAPDGTINSGAAADAVSARFKTRGANADVAEDVGRRCCCILGEVSEDVIGASGIATGDAARRPESVAAVKRTPRGFACGVSSSASSRADARASSDVGFRVARRWRI